MTIVRSRPRLLLLVLGLVAAALLTVKLFSSGDRAPAVLDPHADVKIPAGEFRHLLAATEAASTASSKAELISRGRALFNDPSVARRGETCGGCHTVGTSNADVGTIPRTDPTTGKVLFGRNPPSLIGAAKTAPYGWTGNTPTLQEMVLKTIKGHFTEGATQPDATTAQQAAALVAYISSIRPPTSSFDQGTMSEAAIRGEVLFQGKGGCIACHGGPLFTDNDLHNTLVPNNGDWKDPGAPFPAGAFNTPQLRDVRNSAPYMHNGVFKTLREVIEFYNARSSIAPLNLTPEEINDLVAYMDAL